MLESPVQSGLLSKFGKTETETGLPNAADLKNRTATDEDRFTAVLAVFAWS